MERLENVVSNLKCESANYIIDKYTSINYGIKTCNDNLFKTFENIQLEILFLSNLDYLDLTSSQLDKILIGNYTNLISIKKKLIRTSDIELEEPVIVNNVFNVTNENDWDQTDW